MGREADMLRQAVIDRAVNGAATTPPAARAAAFANAGVDGDAGVLVATVAAHAWRVTDADVSAARTAGHDDDAIFELVVCAALGQATRQLEQARAEIAVALAASTEAAR